MPADDIEWRRLSGIDYVEPVGSCKLKLSNSGPASGTREFLCRWADRFDFAALFLGGVDNEGGSPVVRLPARFPDYETIYAVSVDIEGMGKAGTAGPNNSISYEVARVSIQYGILSGNDGGSDDEEEPGVEVIRTKQMDFSGDLLLEPKGAYKWALDNVPITEQVGSIVPFVVIVIEEFNVRQLTDIKVKELALLQGGCNNALFRNVYLAETIVYLGSSTRSQRSSDGTEVTNIQHTFKYRANSWNMLKRPNVGWANVTPKIHPLIDITKVFTFGHYPPT